MNLPAALTSALDQCALHVRVLERDLAALPGRFDPALGALTRLWREAARSGAWPEAASLEAARARCGWSGIEWDAPRSEFRVLRNGIRLDFGGLGPGGGVEHRRGTAAPDRDGFPADDMRYLLQDVVSSGYYSSRCRDCRTPAPRRRSARTGRQHNFNSTPCPETITRCGA